MTILHVQKVVTRDQLLRSSCVCQLTTVSASESRPNSHVISWRVWNCVCSDPKLAVEYKEPIANSRLYLYKSALASCHKSSCIYSMLASPTSGRYFGWCCTLACSLAAIAGSRLRAQCFCVNQRAAESLAVAVQPALAALHCRGQTA